MNYVFAVARFIVTGIVALLLVLLVVAFEGCTVGPKYVKPTVPTTPAYKEETPASFKESDQWQPAHPGDQTSRGNWWEIFGDPELNTLEEQIAGSNQNLKVAEARFREARAAIRFNRAAQFPTISTSPSASYVKSSDFSPNFPSKIQQSSKGDFVLPFDLSYELDLWGRVRRSVAAAREEAQATAADYQTAKLSLEAELALDYFELRSAEAQKQLLDDTVKAYTDNLQLTLNRFKGGVAPKADVAQAQTQLDTTRVQDYGCHRAKSAIRTCNCNSDRKAARGIQSGPSTAQLPASQHSDWTPFCIVAATPGHSRRGAPSGGGEPADRHCPRGVFSHRDPGWIGRIRRLAGFQLVHLAERLLGRRSSPRADAVRRWTPSRHLRIGARKLRCHSRNLSPDLSNRVPGSRRQCRCTAHS